MGNLGTDFELAASAGTGIAGVLSRGGPIVWLITALSLAALTVILWKILRFWSLGVWADRRAIETVMVDWQDGQTDAALRRVGALTSIRGKVLAAGMDAIARRGFPKDDAEDEVVRVAKGVLADAARGLKLLDIVATVAPLLGLLGTVVGMIAAFQAMQMAGARTDPAMLAGGIWEALLTTAAGMAVAIPVTMALGWFESVLDRLRFDLEDLGTRLLQPRSGADGRLAKAAE